MHTFSEFESAYRGGLCYCWSYSPNGGVGNAVGQEDWLTAEGVTELRGECEEKGFDQKWDGMTLSLSKTPNCGVHQYYHLSPSVASKFESAQVVACFGAHYGWFWGSSCREIAEFNLEEKYQTQVLRDVLQLCDFPEKIGVRKLGDPTDDGINFAVVDSLVFLHVAELARQAEENAEYSAEYSEEDDSRFLAERILDTVS